MKKGVRDRIIELLRNRPGGIMQSFIPRALGVSRSRVSEILGILEDEGLVSRIRVGGQYLVKPSPILVKPAPRGVLRIGLVWSSEYPFITPFAKLMDRELGLRLVVKVYPSAIAVSQALLGGDVELALSPLVTQLYSALVSGGGIRIIGGGAYGGAFILENKEGGGGVASSKLSTMDLCRSIATREGVIEAGRTRYFDEPWEAVRLAALRKHRYMVAWHPLFTRLYRYGYKPIISCSELDASYCCTLASSTRVPGEFMEKIASLYAQAIEEFKRRPTPWLEWYSAEVGIPADMVRDGLKYYGFRETLHEKLVYDALRRAGISLPDPAGTLRGILHRGEQQ